MQCHQLESARSQLNLNHPGKAKANEVQLQNEYCVFTVVSI